MAAISKNVCFDVPDDIVNKQNNTVHKTIKMTFQMILMLNIMKILIEKTLNLKFVIV